MVEDIDHVNSKIQKLIKDNNKSETKLLRQFGFVCKYNDTHKLIEQEDYNQYQQIMKSLGIYNILVNINCFVAIGSIYWKLGGFTQSLKWPILTKIRHPIVILLPSLFISPIITSKICRQQMNDMKMLAEKYRPQLFDPEFNKILVNELNKFKKQKDQEVLK